VAFDSTSFNQRFALGYTANGWNLTANAIWGIQADQRTTTINPDFVNVDPTATKKICNGELGLVGLYSTDTTTPVPGYRRESQFALGPLVGYNFGPVILQAYLTRDVAESNYSGFDTRLWGRIIIPVPDPVSAAAPAATPLRR
jgi:Putative MetA-pathway of phenol degradation